MQTLIDAAALHRRMTSGQRTVILDVRWALGDPRGREHYLAGHLPDAVYVDLETELAAPAEPLRGRHPLPDAQALQESARRWGINAGDTVVVYDDAGGMSAARLWWLLRDGGLEEVLLLDGGLRAWTDAGYPTERGLEQAALGNVVLGAGAMPALGREEAGRFPADGVLLDARAAERYRGDVEPVDPRPGHIPGAVSAPTAANLSGSGRFLSAADLAARFRDLGADGTRPVAVYCGSGVTAAHEIAALEIAGIRAALYPGSFSEWSNHPDLPVATGSEP
ncbi:sulfurtransferase [Paenarthrobacter sp. DKR-5]|uniref:sulfurtransferase n=1 Tax=Paenarthrobacter sp. DKR-5 TaxID=2835535 RepID=UPI001BDC979D|nr:sulfurtransferase [Paenarthrobacter sp. DKR-5]MBT1003096.1 sulfurtransferase [Paenarthrobacter sp. DKR-5]